MRRPIVVATFAVTTALAARALAEESVAPPPQASVVIAPSAGALASARFSAKNSTERNAQERLRDRLGEILTRADLAHDDDREGLEERKKVGDVIRQVKWKDFRTRQRELGANARTAKKRAAFVLAPLD